MRLPFSVYKKVSVNDDARRGTVLRILHYTTRVVLVRLRNLPCGRIRDSGRGTTDQRKRRPLRFDRETSAVFQDVVTTV